MDHENMAGQKSQSRPDTDSDIMGNTAPVILSVRGFPVFLKIAFNLRQGFFAVLWKNLYRPVVRLPGCPAGNPGRCQNKQTGIGIILREIDKKSDHRSAGLKSIATISTDPLRSEPEPWSPRQARCGLRA